MFGGGPLVGTGPIPGGGTFIDGGRPGGGTFITLGGGIPGGGIPNYLFNDQIVVIALG